MSGYESTHSDELMEISIGNAQDIGTDLSVARRGPITDSAIAKLMAEYEATHSVEDYWAFGWQLWPVLRTALAADIYNARNYPIAVANLVSLRNRERDPSRLIRGATYYSQTIRKYIQWLWNVKRGVAPSPSSSCDVLIVGSGDRYQFVGEKWVHYVTVPFAELLEHAGLRCRTWHWQEQPFPIARSSAILEPPIKAELMLTNVLGRFRCTPAAPRWFAEFATFYKEQLDRDLSWENMVQYFSYMVPVSIILERWLRLARPNLVVLDNWYNGQMFAVTLAAHRLGIFVMDLQHGMQEQTHNAYHWWHKEPGGGWSVRPDLFWVWGERAENLFYETNRIQQEILRGGNLWIRQWLSRTDPASETACKEAKKLLEGYSRSVLVTTPPRASDFFRYLKKVISRAPSNWTWIIRTHPLGELDRESIEKELSSSGQAHFQLHKATEWPLYAWLGVVDLHVTVDSTCANEALAFGKPTVLVNKAGLSFFSDFVDRGIMFYAERAEDFFSVAERALDVDPARLKDAARSMFVLDESDTGRAINRVAEIVHSARQKGSL